MSKIIDNVLRYALGSLLMLVSLNAFGGGFYGMMGAEGVPLELLTDSPFTNYFIPSLILFVCVGGSNLFSSIAVFKKMQFATKAVYFSSSIIIIWLITQVAIIGYVSWMQPATAITTIVILILNWIISKKTNKLNASEIRTLPKESRNELLNQMTKEAIPVYNKYKDELFVDENGDGIE
jgi:hypothetical protein